jgi:hypothetical protein
MTTVKERNDRRQGEFYSVKQILTMRSIEQQYRWHGQASFVCPENYLLQINLQLMPVHLFLLADQHILPHHLMCTVMQMMQGALRQE